MRVLAGISFLLMTFVLGILVWHGVLGNIIINDYMHGTLLTIVPFCAIGMFVVMMDSDR
tara:strand:+ start:218 stop:394 length:177 start_codon:yes stop_codon:yes gene_type:complete